MSAVLYEKAQGSKPSGQRLFHDRSQRQDMVLAIVKTGNVMEFFAT